MSTRTTQKQATREAVRAAAQARFEAHGYAATTIRQVAADAGVSVGTVMAHFAGKQGLLEACLMAHIEEGVQRAFADFDAEAPLLDQLLGLARPLYQAYCRHPALSRAMLRLSLFPAEGERFDDPQLEPFLAAVAGIFQAALARGELSRLPAEGRLSAEVYFSTYFMVLVGGLSGRFGPPELPQGPETMLRRLASVLALQLVGLGGDPALLTHVPQEAP